MPSAIDFRTEVPDHIWQGDLLNRQTEADTLIRFLNALGQSPRPLGNNHGYTVAVDAGYGQGKTYFLSRLARQMRSTHLVAYIDAWSDDLANEPLIGLMATLKEALKPVLKEPKVKNAWIKMGRVAKEVGIGAAKKSLAIALTEGAMHSINAVFHDINDDLRKDIRNSIDDNIDALIGHSFNAFDIGHFEPQIRAFNDNKFLMLRMRNQLANIVHALAFTSFKTPIVVIIDELDRCRPTYAIKLLEEIKHLFDVSGVVFVLGLHGDQLGNAISGAYGSKFDGKDYLKRFINRRYRLSNPSRENLVRSLSSAASISEEKFHLPLEIGDNNGVFETCSLIAIVCGYAELFDVSARDLVGFFDILQSCVQICENNLIVPTLLFPLIFRHILNISDEADFIDLSKSRQLVFRFTDKSVHPYYQVYQTQINRSLNPGTRNISARHWMDRIRYRFNYYLWILIIKPTISTAKLPEISNSARMIST